MGGEIGRFWSGWPVSPTKKDHTPGSVRDPMVGLAGVSLLKEVGGSQGSRGEEQAFGFQKPPQTLVCALPPAYA